jgi:hypothetical protein
LHRAPIPCREARAKKNGTPQWKLHASSRSAPPSDCALSRARLKEEPIGNVKLADARGFVKQKLAGAGAWIAGTHPRVCLWVVRLLQHVPQKLDESTTLERKH